MDNFEICMYGIKFHDYPNTPTTSTFGIMQWKTFPVMPFYVLILGKILVSIIISNHLHRRKSVVLKSRTYLNLALRKHF